MNIASIFEKCKFRFNSSVAIADLTKNTELTFNDLYKSLCKVSAFLNSNNVSLGEKVAILCESNIDYLVCDYGVMSSGRVRVPIDESLTLEEKISQLNHSDSKALFYQSRFEDQAQEIARHIDYLKIFCIDDIFNKKIQSNASLYFPKHDAVASLNYTGGTTGHPKAVILTQGGLSSVVQNIIHARNITPSDVMLNVRPTWPIAAIIILAHMAAGGKVILAKKFEAESFLSLLEKYRVNFTSLVPTQLNRLIHHTGTSLYPLPHFKSLEVGAAAISEDLFKLAMFNFNKKIAIIYGLTEASWSCYQSAEDFADYSVVNNTRLKSVGRALFGVELKIRDSDGTECEPHTEGEITIRGEHITPGYWKNDDATQSAFYLDWFKTGDLGKLDENGYLYITGRIKEIIRTGGKTVIPLEVESVLMKHPLVSDAAVIGLPDAEWGEIVLAVIVKKISPEYDLFESELIDWSTNYLSSFKKPKKVIFLTEIPRSHYGKVMRKSLLEKISSISSIS